VWFPGYASAVSFGLVTSSTTATLGAGGWLGLTRQGLPPCKKRQVSWRTTASSYAARRKRAALPYSTPCLQAIQPPPKVPPAGLVTRTSRRRWCTRTPHSTADGQYRARWISASRRPRPRGPAGMSLPGQSLGMAPVKAPRTRQFRGTRWASEGQKRTLCPTGTQRERFPAGPLVGLTPLRRTRTCLHVAGDSNGHHSDGRQDHLEARPESAPNGNRWEKTFAHGTFPDVRSQERGKEVCPPRASSQDVSPAVGFRPDF